MSQTQARAGVRGVLEALSPGTQEALALSGELTTLAQTYLAAKVVSESYQEDALHIAFATVYRADVLTSWNFRYIVNLQCIRQFNSMNLAQGYQPLEIRSPRELFVEEDPASNDDDEER